MPGSVRLVDRPCVSEDEVLPNVWLTRALPGKGTCAVSSGWLLINGERHTC